MHAAQTEAERMQVILGHQHTPRIAGGVPAEYFFVHIVAKITTLHKFIIYSWGYAAIQYTWLGVKILTRDTFFLPADEINLLSEID